MLQKDYMRFLNNKLSSSNSVDNCRKLSDPKHREALNVLHTDIIAKLAKIDALLVDVSKRKYKLMSILLTQKK